jgi:mannose/fructose/N-acetylgalactosamine-specific phosphotransferase system component IIB
VEKSKIIWRIDDRLIHGQIIIGWCGQLPIENLVVCDDKISQTEWEKNLLLLAAPPNLQTGILSTIQTRDRYESWNTNKKMTLVLLKSPHVLKKLYKRGVKIEKVNVGGIHYQEGRREYLSYVYLSDAEITIFKELMNKGIQFECRDLPNSTTYNLKKIIEKKQ